MIEDLHSISSTEKDVQSFSRMVGGVFVFMGALSFLFAGDYYGYFFIGGGIFILWGEFAPRTLRPFQRIWMFTALIIGLVMTQIILGVFFYLIITPVGFLARIAGKQFLDVRWKLPSATYWIPRGTRQHIKESYTQQF